MTVQSIDPQVRVRRYRWIPFVYVGAMLLVVAVNSALIYFATRDPVGIVAASPYEKGLHYNNELAQRARQDALGWQVAAGYFAQAGGSGEIVVEMRDKAGHPLTGLRPRVRLSRPVEVAPPIELTLSETGSGRYVAMLTAPRHGQWDMDIAVDQPQPFIASHRIVVP